jgi:conserved oligomeric Golgi complex subunit 3
LCSKGSPADLHGMWYPTVRRTLACLSRLYRCVDRAIFQGLSQEALSACVQSIAEASTAIKAKKVCTVLNFLYLYPTEIPLL